MQVHLVFILFASLWTSTVISYSLKDAKKLFAKFIQDYDRKYKNEQEKQTRFQIFVQNLNKAELLNKMHEHSVHGVTEFMDLTVEEFINTYTGLKLSNVSKLFGDVECKTAQVIGKDAPDVLDWREHNVVTEVKRQGTCGSCYAFSTVGDIEGKYAIKHKTLVSLSAQQILDCGPGIGCIGGIPRNEYRYLIENDGIETDADYPYVEAQNKCTFDNSKIKVKLTDCQDYNIKTQDDLKQLLHEQGPLSISVAGEGLHTYTEGVVGKDCMVGHINHAVLLVGYGTDPIKGDYWLVKNSWSDHWGENGYFRMERGEGKYSCGVMENPITTSIVA